MSIVTLNNRAINRSDTASSGQVWTATSATAADFQDAASIGHSSVYLTSDAALSGGGYLSSNLTIYNAGAAGTGIIDDITSGHIRVDKTGWYLCIWQMTGNSTSGTQSWNPYIATWDGSSESNKAYGYAHGNNGDDDTFTCTIHALIDIDNVSNVKLHMKYDSADNVTLYATGQSVTSMTLIRLGDT